MGRFLPDRTSCLALLSGLLLAMAFPRPDVASLAWVGLVPLFLVMDRRPFRSGFVAGVGFFGLVLYWLNIVMTNYGKLHPVFSVVAYLLLVGYLALFFGAATWASCRLKEKLDLSPVWTLPVFWVGLEFLRSFLLTGFPWATLGYSQQSHLHIIQSADLFGVYGLSFLLVLSNGVLASCARSLWERQPGYLPWPALVLTVCLFAGNLGYGHFRLGQGLDYRNKTLQTSLVQGNIDQSVKWDPAHKASTVSTYGRLSRQAAADGPLDLIVWPESATPFYFQNGGPLSARVESVARGTGAHLLFGSPAYEVLNRQNRYLNSAFLLSGEGRGLGRSDKVHLVPFGEYVPLGRFLPFIDKMVVGIGDFSPGAVSPLPLNGESLGVLVCFEGIFPELARDFVRQGADALVNITNDAWFGRSSAPFQHLAMTRFRAVENRVWVARAANTGITAFIAPSGRISERTKLFETAFLNGSIGLGADPTLYNRIGDLGPVLCLVLGLWWLVRTRRRLAIP